MIKLNHRTPSHYQEKVFFCMIVGKEEKGNIRWQSLCAFRLWIVGITEKNISCKVAVANLISYSVQKSEIYMCTFCERHPTELEEISW